MPRPDGLPIASVLDALDIGLIVFDGEVCVQAWNEWMVSASGVAADTAYGKRLDEIFPGLEVPRLSMAIEGALESGTSSILTHSLHTGIFPLRTRSGRVMIHNVSIRPGDGEVARCIVQISDVTMAAEREGVLRKRQNARYDAVAESALDAILTLDIDGKIRLANPAAAKEFGYGPDELIGQPITLLFDKDDATWKTAWAALVDGASLGLGRPIELVALRKNGSPSYLEMPASAWKADSRTFFTAILRNVNERRLAEEALRRLNQTLEQRVEERTADRDRMWRLSTDVMLVARLDGIITATNPAWTNLLGWEAARLQGSQLRNFVVPDDQPKLDAGLDALTKHAVPSFFELRVRTRDGGSRWIAWSAVVEGDFLHAVGRDITAEREASEALRLAEEALRHSQKMEAIGQLTGGIAHDFNNLLAGIIGSMDILKRRIASKRYAEVDKFVDAAVSSANRAAALTHRLLAFARHQPLDPRALDVNRLVSGTEDLLRRSIGEQIEIRLQLNADVWPILADANQLENALLNLSINSRDAMPSGGRLLIETANAHLAKTDRLGPSEMEPGDYTVICVTDSGTGMSQDTIVKAFDPFFTTKPIGAGTGLGLSMVYGFVKQSHGHVRIESEIGKGTTVKLYLPRHRGVLSDEIVHDSVELPHGSGERVLLVEDDPSVRLLVAELLRELGYTCVEAGDSTEALPILTSKTHLDLMITDVGLPGMNGRQLAEIARQHHPGLKILLVTGYAEHAMVRTGFLGPDMEMVTKPFAVDALAVKIREMIASS